MSKSLPEVKHLLSCRRKFSSVMDYFDSLTRRVESTRELHPLITPMYIEKGRESESAQLRRPIQDQESKPDHACCAQYCRACREVSPSKSYKSPNLITYSLQPHTKPKRTKAKVNSPLGQQSKRINLITLQNV